MSFQSIKNVFELDNLTSAEIICHTQDVGLLTRSLKCVKCNIDMKMKPFERSCDKFAWRCRKCRSTKSIRTGSWFSRSHLPLQTILQITHMWCERKPSWLVRRELNIAQNTVIDWYNFCREVCLQIMLKLDDKIGGEGKVVELYDCKLEKLKYTKGQFIKGNYVFGGMEKDSDQCFLKVLPDTSQETLLSVFTINIKQGTKIIWDHCKACEGLGDSGLEYLKVNYSISFEDFKRKEEFNYVEKLWSCMKTSLPDFNFNRGNFSSYLAEYMYRRLRQHEPSLFDLFINDIIKIYPSNQNEYEKNWRCESPIVDAALLTNSDPMWSTSTNC